LADKYFIEDYGLHEGTSLTKGWKRDMLIVEVLACRHGEGAFSHMLPLMCFSTSTRFMKTSLLSPTIVVKKRSKNSTIKPLPGEGATEKKDRK